MQKIDVSVKAEKMSGAKAIFRFNGMVAGENADAWVYRGCTDKAMVVFSPVLGVLRFAKAKLQKLETGFPECDVGFAEWVISKAKEEIAAKSG